MDNGSTRNAALVFWTERRDGYLHVFGAFGYESTDVAPAWGSYSEVRKDGLLFQNLTITSQGNDASYSGDTTQRALYGFDVEYRNVFSLDLRDAEQHVKSLRVLDRRLTKIRETQGYPKSFGQFVGQVAQAVGAKVFYFRQDVPGRYVYSVRRGIADAISHLDNIEYQWQQDGKAVAS